MKKLKNKLHFTNNKSDLKNAPILKDDKRCVMVKVKNV